VKNFQYQIRKGDKDTMKWAIEQRVGRAPKVDIAAKVEEKQLKEIEEKIKRSDPKESLSDLARVCSEYLRVKKTTRDNSVTIEVIREEDDSAVSWHS
jgi:hypothetical protein